MDNIQNIFRKGAKGYTPATMWFTGGNINKKEMTYQIEGFQKQEIHDFFIHPSEGTQGDYLGDYFFGMINHAVDEAKRLGMNFWIYDEYNWPSGAAAGQVLAEEPWTHASCVCKLEQCALPGESIVITLPDSKRVHTIPLLFTADGAEVSVTLDGDNVHWTNTSDKKSTLEVYYSRWMMGKNPFVRFSEVAEVQEEGYIDTLDRDTVNVFIRKTHEKYKEQIGKDFGSCVKGVFTDEVVIIQEGREPGEENIPILPWSRLFPEKFKERNGYDICPRLKDLMDRSDIKVCIDYWETVSDLFMQAYMDLTYNWCKQNNLIYTGHMYGEESIELSVYRGGDPYEYYKRFTWPGIDTICTYFRINDYSYNLAAKRASSAAHFLHKERVLSETYTVSGWEISLRDMKRIFNRLAVLGISFLQFMGSRFDFMPGADNEAMTNNWQNPLFKHYNGFSKYISNIQWLVANTEYHARTMLLYPMTTVRATLPPLPLARPDDGEMNLTVDGLINGLIHLHVPFELGFEQVIDESVVENGMLKTSAGNFDTLILPCTRHLKEKTFNKLKQFAASGGKIIAVNGKPEWVIGDCVYKADALPNIVEYDCHEYEKEGEYITDNENFKKLPAGKFTAQLEKALKTFGELPSEIVKLDACEGLMSAVRKNKDTYYVIIINDSDRDITAKGENLTDKPFRAINTENGNLKPINRNGSEFELTLAPYESVVLEISDKVELQKSAEPIADRKEIALENTTFQIEEKNTALPQMWQLRGEKVQEILNARRVYNPKRICELAQKATQDDLVLCRGFGNHYIPIKSQRDWFGWYPVDRQLIEPGETVVCIYDFVVDSVPENLELVSDPQWNTVWYLNNEQLYQTSTRRIWHYANPVFDISDIATPGKNRLVSICTIPDYNRKFALPCAVLKGDFRVFNDFVLTQKSGGNELHCWNDQGYVFHTGDGIYKAEFTISDSQNAMLEMETTDVAEVFINDKLVGKRLWDPYVLDISDFILPGKNKLEIRVTSTLSNFIYKSKPSGIKDAKIWLNEKNNF